MKLDRSGATGSKKGRGDAGGNRSGPAQADPLSAPADAVASHATSGHPEVPLSHRSVVTEPESTAQSLTSSLVSSRAPWDMADDRSGAQLQVDRGAPRPLRQ